MPARAHFWPLISKFCVVKAFSVITQILFYSVETEFMNGEDLNGNGEEQNNHIEEFEFRKGEGYKCEEEDEEDQSQNPANEMLSSNWSSSFPIVVTTSEDQKLDEDVVDAEEACWKTTVASELGSSAQSSTETLIPGNNFSE